MTNHVYNFGAGPAMLPVSVMEQIQAEMLDFKEMGISIIEISHRTKEFGEVLDDVQRLFRKLTNLPDQYKIIFVHGGAQMQFSAVPMNFISRSASRKAIYVESGVFAKHAYKEAERYGKIKVISSADTNYDRIPSVNVQDLDSDASYVHITSNNTIVGTQWNAYPETGDLPLIVDATSDILSHVVDFSHLGVMYAGLQKNLGPSGVAIVIIREDLLGHALPETPKLLNYEVGSQNNSLTNTTNTFAIYVSQLVLQWIEDKGGIAALEARNRKKAKQLYEAVDGSQFYNSIVQKEYRSFMNVPFHLPSDDLLNQFLKEADERGLYALKGHRAVGGVRASIYNAMPVRGVEALTTFMHEFEHRNG